MNLRDLKIGPRLGAGFALVLLSAGGLLAGSIASSQASRASLQQVLDASGARQDAALDMRQQLMQMSVSVRNMGLHTEFAAVQQAEQAAKKDRAAYLAARARLDGFALSAEEKGTLDRMTTLDASISKHFDEAVDLAAQMNSEQAAKVIAERMDPLSSESMALIGKFIELQKQRAAGAAAQAQAQTERSIATLIGIGLLVLLGAAVTAWRVTLSITRPIRAAVGAAARVAEGDLVGPIEVTGRDEASELLRTLAGMQASLARTVGEVRHGAEAIKDASSEIAAGNLDLSARTEQQASSLQQTAASVEELTGAVRQNAQSATQGNERAQTARTVAQRAGVIVERMVSTMGQINESSRKVVDIISVIDSIAFQTNILALNAAVEAARAGEAGRGFAVVASEVRGLAQRSGDAAREIKQLIGASVERVDVGSDLVSQAGQAMQEVVGAIQDVATLMSQISSASSEQSVGIGQVNTAVSQMDAVTQQNAALVEQASAAAESLNRQAAHLVEAVAVFQA